MADKAEEAACCAAIAAPADKAAEPAPGSEAAPWLMALRSADICVLYQRPDLLYTKAVNLPAVLQAHWRVLCRDSDLFPAAIAGQMEAIKRLVLAGGPPARLECRLPSGPAAAPAGQTGAEPQAGTSDSRPLWFRFFVEAHYDAQGKIAGVVTTGVNISELRAREDVLKVLLREVNHRSKNLLAIIQSLAAQTARFCHSPGGFLKKFQGRLQSLSSSQDLVTDSDWRGALLRDLVFAQLRFYNQASAGRQQCSIKVQGENPYLFPSAALHIGLALHELIINSAAFGALAQGAGAITIDCRAENCAPGAPPAGNEAENNAFAAGKMLQLSWREEFAPEHGEEAAAVWGAEQGTKAGKEEAAGSGADNSAQARFGSIMLERIVPQSLGSWARYSIKNGMVEYILNIPPTQFA